jgi:hypothetical protein
LKNSKVVIYVFIESNFSPKNPIEILLEIQELKEFGVICNEVESPSSKHSVEYNNLLPVDFTLHTLKLLGFEKFEHQDKIDDYSPISF